MAFEHTRDRLKTALQRAAGMKGASLEGLLRNAGFHKGAEHTGSSVPFFAKGAILHVPSSILASRKPLQKHEF